MKKIILTLLLIITAELSAQNNQLDSLKAVITDLENSVNKLPIKIKWEWIPKAEKYDIYYCSADDTSLIPIREGMNSNLVWDWQTGSTVYNYFWVKKPLKKYLRIGIIGIDSAGQKTMMRIYDVN